MQLYGTVLYGENLVGNAGVVSHCQAPPMTCRPDTCWHVSKMSKMLARHWEKQCRPNLPNDMSKSRVMEPRVLDMAGSRVLTQQLTRDPALNPVTALATFDIG